MKGFATSAVAWLLAATMLTACATENADTALGGEWYVRSMPATSSRKVDAHLALVRERNAVKIVAVPVIGLRHRFYEPNCVLYESPAGPTNDPYREIDLVCGDHWPARVAFLSNSGVSMDADGLRPVPGVEMHTNSTVAGPGGALEPREFIPLAEMLAAAERQPKNARNIDPALSRANHSVLAALLITFVSVVLVMRWYRRILR